MTQSTQWLADRLQGRGAPILIDGGMGTELQKAGVAMHDKVWSGRAVLSNPTAVRQVHENFIRAGAEVIIANTFAAARHMLAPGGLGEHVDEVNTNAVKLAQQARDATATQPVAIAGSICEWTFVQESDWNTPEAVRRSVGEQAELLHAAGAELLALEMCERPEFSTAAIEAASEIGLPLWIGVSAMRRQGAEDLAAFSFPERSFDELVRAIAKYPAMAFNVMHTPVPDVDDALRITRKYWDGPVGVYPEAGHFIMPNWQFVDVIEPADLAEAARGWVADGVRMVGGCCGLGPEHIAAMRETL